MKGLRGIGERRASGALAVFSAPLGVLAIIVGITSDCQNNAEKNHRTSGHPRNLHSPSLHLLSRSLQLQPLRLEKGSLIAVDSKAPLSGYLRAVEATDEESRKAGLREHVQAVRGHIRALAQRDYAAGLGGDVDMVVLFLPGDPFLAAAFAEDPDLQVEALRAKVLLATPTTLVALLRTVAIYHQQRALAENAQVIAATARDLYDRAAKFGEDLAKTGRGLKTAVGAYNSAVGSFDRRFLPMGQKLQEMKVTEQSRRELTAPAPLDEAVREVRTEG